MKFSKFFNLNKDQTELDFVDISLEKDTPLFIDPYAISKRSDVFSIECHSHIVDFFENVMKTITNNETAKAKLLLNNLHEPNETRLGLSSKKPNGRGVAGEQSGDLYRRLSESKAAQTGFLKDLEDCQLIIPGINRDKISDVTTNIIKRQLALYTKIQCDYYDIPTNRVVLSPFWNEHDGKWEQDYFELPIYKNKKILLVPKAIVRYTLAYDYQDYYNHFVLNFLKEEEIHAGSSLVKTLKNGKKRVTKKDLKKKYPLAKEFLYTFSKDNPTILESYKQTKGINITPLSSDEIEKRNPEAIKLHDLNYYKNLLAGIPTGTNDASAYHNEIKGILTAIFYPSLIYPNKEEPIHDGRKRIDITFSNADDRGFFFRLGNKIPCQFIMIECKNYKADPANPELDQLSGRFSPRRGQFGILTCRTIDNKKLFYQRCKDTASDDRGYIIALDDKDILQLLEWRINKEEYKIDEFLEDLYKKLVM